MLLGCPFPCPSLTRTFECVCVPTRACGLTLTLCRLPLGAPGVLALTTTGSGDVQALRSGDVFDVEYIQCGKQFKKLGRYVVNQVSSPSASHSVKSIPVCLLPLRL